MSFDSEPTQRGVNDEHLDEHSERHNECCEASAIAEYYHHSEESLQKCEYHKGSPATLEEQGGIAREDEVVGLQLIDDVERNEHAHEDSQKEDGSIEEAIALQYFEKLFHHSNPYRGKNQAKKNRHSKSIGTPIFVQVGKIIS